MLYLVVHIPTIRLYRVNAEIKQNSLDTQHDTFLPQPPDSRTLLRSSSRTWEAYTASKIINRDRSLLYVTANMAAMRTADLSVIVMPAHGLPVKYTRPS